ncbi:MAG: ferrous iron transport protein B [Eubacteriales bacterium]|nr:ferrous iron transport protein B [Eubacteriales bacterium]MDD4391084.1 ferrous iron transport protein B [Eubacteriales bacterium]
MNLRIALAGNPNSGKTTLFNALTGSNQFVGNWPGVTVEKKEGTLKINSDVIVTDLPGIYSLSPYTPEEVVAGDYLINERPDAILNIVDGTNLERNLYLTTQLVEIGIPVVIAINMIDVVEKNGDTIQIEELARELGCKIVKISALKNTGIKEAAEAAIEAALSGKTIPMHKFSGNVEHALAHIEEAAVHDMPKEQQRWYSIKIFERNEKVLQKLNLSEATIAHIEEDIQTVETLIDDDAEGIIANERYVYIGTLIKNFYKRKNDGLMSTSDKIDKVVTNRWLALPIFAVIMFLVYYISITTVGGWATDWVNEGAFGEGFHLFGQGSNAYEQAAEEYVTPGAVVGAFESAAEAEGLSPESARGLTTEAYLYDDMGNVEETIPVTFADYTRAADIQEPDPANFGVWIPSIPVLLEAGLERANAADWLHGIVLDGAVAGVGAVIGFVPQLLVLFLLLAFLESCGYMARIAFVMDRIFRKFGLSGKSFIPMLIGTGCGVPGIMASRTIENERDRRMTIITTTFIPCGAKIPIIALIAGALFGRAWWVAPSAYFLGIAAIIISGIILKKTTMFLGNPAPFIMELPAYRLPTASNVLRSMWERGWAFIKKAGTVILIFSMILWLLTAYGMENGSFGIVENMNNSMLASLGGAIAWIFSPLGFGNWQSAVATITGLIAKENVVATFGVLFGSFGVAENGWQIWTNMQQVFSPLAAYSFLVFNLLCAPCVAAVAAIRKEMNSTKWTLFALAYQTGFAYASALIIYQIGSMVMGHGNLLGFIVALVILSFIVYMMLRPYSQAKTLNKKVS